MLAAIHKAVASVLADGTAAQNRSGGRPLDQAEAAKLAEPAQLAGKVAEIVARKLAACPLDLSASNQGPGPAPSGIKQQMQMVQASNWRLRRSLMQLALVHSSPLSSACLCQAHFVRPGVIQCQSSSLNAAECAYTMLTVSIECSNKDETQ